MPIRGGIAQAVHICKNCGVKVYVGFDDKLNEKGLPVLIVRHQAAPRQKTCGKYPVPFLQRPEKRRPGRASPRRPVGRIA